MGEMKSEVNMTSSIVRHLVITSTGDSELKRDLAILSSSAEEGFYNPECRSLPPTAHWLSPGRGGGVHSYRSSATMSIFHPRLCICLSL